jgi:hypothetical protein
MLVSRLVQRAIPYGQQVKNNDFTRVRLLSCYFPFLVEIVKARHCLSPDNSAGWQSHGDCYLPWVVRYSFNWFIESDIESLCVRVNVGVNRIIHAFLFRFRNSPIERHWCFPRLYSDRIPRGIDSVVAAEQPWICPGTITEQI